MDLNEIFAKLQIEPTKAEKAIKAAYRAQLVHTNPEDDAEGFKALREAYEQAVAYARSEDEPTQTNTDDTPSGQWVQEAARLYGRLSTRCNAALWQELFERDVFVSLEDGEECRIKLLIFMMNHIYFPDNVWKLIASKLAIREETAMLREHFQKEYVDFLVRRCMTKEIVDFTLFRGADDADYDTYIHYYNTAWDTLNRKDYDKTAELLSQAEAMGITHPYMELVRAVWERETGETACAGERLERLHGAYPQDSTILYQLALYYHAVKDTERAVECLRILKARDRNHYMANYLLAQIYTEQGDYEAARDCIRMVLRRGNDETIQKLRRRVNHELEPAYRARWEHSRDIFAAKELAWCLLQDDRFLAADELTQEMEPLVPDAMREEYLGLCARIYMGQSRFERTLATAAQWLSFMEKIPAPTEPDALAEYRRDIEIAHRIRMSVYHLMGRGCHKYYDNALEEYDYYRRQEQPEPNALIDVARICLERQEYDRCLETAQVLLERCQVQYAYALMMEAYVKLWDAGGVIRCGMQCIHFFPSYERPYEEVARVYFDLKQQDKLDEVLELAKQNNVTSIYLEAYACKERVAKNYPIGEKLKEFDQKYRSRLVAAGDLTYYKQGYPVITHYLHLFPNPYLLNVRGLFSMAAKEYDAALKDFHKILERDPADQFALNNIGCVLKYLGRYEEALPFFERAHYYMYREDAKEPNAMPLGNMAHTYELMGEYARAAETYLRLADEIKSRQGTMSSLKDITINLARRTSIICSRNPRRYSLLDYCEPSGDARIVCNASKRHGARARFEAIIYVQAKHTYITSL